MFHYCNLDCSSYLTRIPFQTSFYEYFSPCSVLLFVVCIADAYRECFNFLMNYERKKKKKSELSFSNDKGISTCWCLSVCLSVFKYLKIRIHMSHLVAL